MLRKLGLPSDGIDLADIGRRRRKALQLLQYCVDRFKFLNSLLVIVRGSALVSEGQSNFLEQVEDTDEVANREAKGDGHPARSFCSRYRMLSSACQARTVKSINLGHYKAEHRIQFQHWHASFAEEETRLGNLRRGLFHDV